MHSGMLTVLERFGHVAFFFVGFTCACSGDANSGSSVEQDHVDASADDFSGRWDILIRFEWDDDADRSKFEFVEAAGDFHISSCSADNTCLAENWSCAPTLNSQPGAISDGALHISWDVPETNTNTVAQLELSPLGGGTLRGALTASPCPDGNSQCDATVLACSASAGLEPSCEGNDYTGLQNCECLSRTTCP
jgi:hypothetical protein